MFKLSHLLTEDSNLLEIYICPKKINHENVVDISLDVEKINKIKDRFKNIRTIQYNIFYKNNLSYTYDVSNDNQIVTMKTTENESFLKTKGYFNDFYAISFKEDKLPTHYFPCTNDIDYYNSITINEIRINNRVMLIIKDDDGILSACIQYRHSANVDLDKTQETINLICKTISSLV